MVKPFLDFFHEFGLLFVLIFEVFDETDGLDVMETVEMGFFALAHFHSTNKCVIFTILREAHEDGLNSMGTFGLVKISAQLLMELVPVNKLN